MSSVILVENLSKRYIIGHQKQEHYTSLRDVLTNGAKRVFNKLSHPFVAPAHDPAYEEFWALKDVSFEIQQGDRVGIIGRNGAGKSTLLKILSRITEPTCGKVSIKGRVASLLEVGTGFHPELSGRENIFLNGAILGMSKSEIKKQFDAIVAFAQVEKFLDTPVKHYSSGMYVRLAFAVAAHLEPEILIVDEVLAVGDAQFQKKCMTRMEEAGREGRTILFVSHNMTAIRTLCIKAISLNEGQVSKVGSAVTVVNEYLTQGLNGKTEQVWHHIADAPGNESIRVSSLNIRSEANSSNRFTIRSPLQIEFTYMLSLQDSFFYIGFHLKTLAGECIFVTACPPRRSCSGSFRSICHIPSDLLNAGTYSIHVYFVKDGNNVLLEMENPLIFEVQDVEREEGAWLGNYPGAVRPNLKWEREPCISPWQEI
jgi:lipopolysaccharide transport system ATP-binding protein